PELKDGVVRVRVDGVLRSYMHLPRPVMDRVVSRIKVMGNMDVADRLRPHAGRAHVQVAGVDYDLRLSTVPTRQSEKVVVRILGPGRARSLADIDVPDAELRRLRQLFGNRDGLVVVTGPTGSGKTTTLYAALQDLASGKINIITVEDPVEYELSAVTQIQVAPPQGLTFASILRTILRQDPDIILVGEIRDLETAEIAFQASLTGHLVLTTLHTADAVGVLGRLAGLGVTRANIGTALRGIVAQRLVRRLCPECRVRTDGRLTPDEQHLSRLYGVVPLFRAGGCERCSGSGYRGRIPILEVLVKTPEIEQLIAEGEGAQRIQRAAEQFGMTSLLAAGLTRVRSGETTLEEMERVLGIGTEAQPQPAGTHVMVVGRDEPLRHTLRATLEGSGYRISEATDSASAWPRLSAGGDATLVVIELGAEPGGRDLLVKLKSSPATAGLPVIAVLDADRPLDRALVEEGVDDVIHTPLDPAAVVARVRACLRRRGVEPAEGDTQELRGLPASSEPSIAVLPFADLSQAQDQAYLCDGLAEELTHALSRIDGLLVAARTSAFRFRSIKGDARDIGKQLGVSAILEGSVQKSGSRVRITVRLVNVEEGTDLLSERYERDLIDLFELEDEITKRVCERLRVVLLPTSPGPSAPPPTTSVDAHELYLKGRHEWNRRTEEGLTRSLEYFAQAVARDPDYATAYAALADTYVTLSMYGARRPAEVMPLAFEAAARALTIDPNAAEALVAQGCVRAMYMWDWYCDDDFLRALEIEPNNAMACHWYATNYLMPLGRFAAARVQLDRALQLDPQSMPIKASVGLLLYFERRYEEAAAHQRRVIAADPAFGLAQYFLAQAWTEMGRFDEAIDTLRRAKRLTVQSPEMDSALGYALARAGRTEAGEAALNELVQLSAARYVSPALLAQIAAGLGDSNRAMRYLDEAFGMRATELAWLAVRPSFDALHGDSRFADLCFRILPARPA
ncbi:MAG: Flp pilus assembly complex ATPase component TadA, partial [Acidobacteria bacterium]|nr:Flp pilus assembly complex ATPase component TadA [Acidobacteriota bacterium]